MQVTVIYLLFIKIMYVYLLFHTKSKISFPKNNKANCTNQRISSYSGYPGNELTIIY